jgi:hypothetical protein
LNAAVIRPGDRIFNEGNGVDTYFLFASMGEIPVADLSYSANTAQDGTVIGSGDIDISTGGNSATIPAATSLVAGLMHPDSWTKLNNIEAGAEKHKNTTATWSDTTKTTNKNSLIFSPGDGLTNATNIPLVTKGVGGIDGLMLSADKDKLDGIAPGATVNVDTTATWSDTKQASDKDSLIFSPGSGTTNIPTANASDLNGLMSFGDKAKLDGIASGAEKNVNTTADWSNSKENTNPNSLIFSPGVGPANVTTIPVATISTSIGGGIDGLMSVADKDALKNLIDNPVTGNVQSNWTETVLTSDAFILNKPTLVESLGQLSDVTLASEAAGNVLYKDATGWINKQLDYSNLSGVPTIPSSLTEFKIDYDVADVPNSGGIKHGVVTLSHKVDGAQVLDTSVTYIPLATASNIGLFDSADKTKLDGIAPGATVNVDTTATWIDTKQTANKDSLKLSPGNNYTIIPKANASDLNGLMTFGDKAALDKLVTDSSPGKHPFGYNKTQNSWKESLPYDFSELPALV